LNALLAEKKAAIHAHLSNNFDTPAVLDELNILIAKTNSYMAQPGIKYPLLMSVATYVSFIFKVMGLFYDDKFTVSEEEGASVNVEQVVAPYIDALSKFRDDVRAAAKNQVRSL